MVWGVESNANAMHFIISVISSDAMSVSNTSFVKLLMNKITIPIVRRFRTLWWTAWRLIFFDIYLFIIHSSSSFQPKPNTHGNQNCTDALVVGGPLGVGLMILTSVIWFDSTLKPAIFLPVLFLNFNTSLSPTAHENVICDAIAGQCASRVLWFIFFTKKASL